MAETLRERVMRRTIALSTIRGALTRVRDGLAMQEPLDQQIREGWLTDLARALDTLTRLEQ